MSDIRSGGRQAGGETALHEHDCYGDITSVTSNAFFCCLHTANKRYQLAKNGFDGANADFEQLIKARDSR